MYVNPFRSLGLPFLVLTSRRRMFCSTLEGQVTRRRVLLHLALGFSASDFCQSKARSMDPKQPIVKDADC